MNNLKISNIKNIYLLLVAGLCLVFSCQDPYEGTTFTAYEELPASSYFKSQPEQFSLWVELLEHANLYNTLNLQEVYTIFAPTNDAMEAYLAQNGLSEVTDIPEEDADYLVKYHVLYGTIYDQSRFTNGVIPAPTVTDDKLSIEFKEGGLNAIYVNGVSRIVELDIMTTNAIIHSINQVLIPEKETILEKLRKTRYKIFNEAVVLTGYQKILNTIKLEETDNNGNPVIKKPRHTVFAVSDSAFVVNGIFDIETLKRKIGVSETDYTSPENKLNKYVAYHILPQLMSTDELASFPEGESSRNINTLAPNELINISSASGELILNYKEDGSGITLVRENINTKNGVIHETGHWMPVETPPIVTVLWDLADYPELAAVVNSFQSADLTTAYNKTLAPGEIPVYTWKSVPETKSSVVTYRNNRSNDGVYYHAHNYDHIRLEPGPSGWVEMESPVLIAGTYKITLQYISGRYTTNTGSMQMSLDGQALGGQVVISNPTEDEIRQTVLSDSYEFTETDSHTLRIVGIDGKLLTLDYILFEPVN